MSMSVFLDSVFVPCSLGCHPLQTFIDVLSTRIFANLLPFMEQDVRGNWEGKH